MWIYCEQFINFRLIHMSINKLLCAFVCIWTVVGIYLDVFFLLSIFKQGQYPGGGGGGYPQQGGHGGYPQAGGFPQQPQAGGYPPQGGFPPQQGGYPPQQGGYPGGQGGYGQPTGKIQSHSFNIKMCVIN